MLTPRHARIGRYVLVVLIVLLSTRSSVAQDDPKAATEKQKQSIVANFTKLKIPKPFVAETDGLIVYSPLPENRVKSLSENLQKVFTFAKANLKFEATEKLWPGKLSVVVFSDPRQLDFYLRTIEQVKPERDNWYMLNIRSELPVVLVCPERASKSTDTELTNDVGTLVSMALLNKKGGTATLPIWVQMGYGRITSIRADSKMSTLANYRAKAKVVVVGSRTKPAPVRLDDVWSGAKNAESELVWTSLLDYMAYGPGAENFPKFLNGFRPGENGAEGSVMAALESAEWKSEELELAWKRWVLTGK